MFDREKFLDSAGKPLTQSLFLEFGYTDTSLYSIKEIDHEYKGHLYPSIKRLYLLEDDPTEYTFANKYFLNWRHWLRICENKQIRIHIDEWREELEFKLRARAVKKMIQGAEDGNFQSTKWLVDRGWAQKGAGRPSKSDIERETRVQANLRDEYSADILRLQAKQG